MKFRTASMLVIALTLTGCAGTEAVLTPAGANVQVRDKKPEAPCKFIGQVEGRRSTFFSGTQSHFHLVKNAISDLQNNAATLGGNIVVNLGEKNNSVVSQLIPTDIIVKGDVYQCPN